MEILRLLLGKVLQGKGALRTRKLVFTSILPYSVPMPDAFHTYYSALFVIYGPDHGFLLVR